MHIKFQYVGGLLEEAELIDVRAIAEEHGYELKEYDISGKPMAHGGELEGFLLFLTPALLEAISTGVVSSATYDALKTIVAKIAKAVSGKTYSVVRPGNNLTETKAKLYLTGTKANLKIELPSENTDAIDSAIHQVVEAYKDANK
jgi:hypothetical protein